MEQAAWFGIPWPEFNHGLIYTDTVKYAPSASPQSLLDFYSLRYKESASKQGWLQRIRNGQIHVDGNVIVTSDSILRNGACLEYVRHPWREPEVPFRLQILFEDDHLVAVNKPSGLQVLPGGLFQQRTVLTQLQWRSDSSDKQATHGIAALHEKDLWKPSPVHRLGRGTSGVLLCAKSPAAKSQIAADLAAGTSASSRSRCEDDSEAERQITKTYRALASGIIPTDEVVVDQPIGKVRYAGVAGGLYMACETGAGGKPSRSRVTVLQRNLIDNQSLVEVQIFTGRPHQIRIHLAAIGHPLVGDPLYLAGGQPRPLSTTAISRNLEEDLDPADDGQERATICTTTIEVNNSSIVHLAAEVPHSSIIDAGLQKVLTQSQLSGGLDDEPPSQTLFATVQEVLTQSELSGGLEPSQILLTNLCCNVMLANEDEHSRTTSSTTLCTS